MDPASAAFQRVFENPFAYAAFKSTEPWLLVRPLSGTCPYTAHEDVPAALVAPTSGNHVVPVCWLDVPPCASTTHGGTLETACSPSLHEARGAVITGGAAQEYAALDLSAVLRAAGFVDVWSASASPRHFTVVAFKPA